MGLKIEDKKDFIQKFHDKNEKIGELQNEIKGLQGNEASTSMDIDNSESFFESDDDDDLEILATPPKLFEEVTLDEDEDADGVTTENISKPSIICSPSPSLDKPLHSWLRPLLQGSIQICQVCPHFKGKCHFHFLIH